MFVTGILHGRKFGLLEQMIQAGGVKEPLGGIARGSWLIFSTEMMALAVIAVVASFIQGGGRIVLLCAITMGVNAALLFHFVGPFLGVYITIFVMLIYIIGGSLQGKG